MQDDDGGDSDLIYEYHVAAAAAAQWRALPVTLNKPNEYHTAFVVPASTFPTCDS